MEFDKLVEQIGDDVEFAIGDQKVKGADLKSYFNSQRSTLSQREQALQAIQRDMQAKDTEIARLKTVEDNFSLLARAAADPNLNLGGDQQRPQPADEFATYENDPLLGDFAKKFKGRLSKEFREEIIGELKPLLDGISQRNEQLTRFSLLEKNQRDFRDAGEWPEGWDYRKAQEYAKEKGYWMPNGGDKYGMIDVGRVHSEVTEPIRRQKWETEVRTKAEQEAIEKLRANGAVIQMPQRSMGGGGKPVEVKGRNGEEIISNALSQAAADMETQRMLSSLRG